MQTGHGNESPRHFREFTAPDFYHFPPAHIQFKVIDSLAGKFTGMAIDAPVGIEVESVLLAH